jgi:geranylgeranyl pyrophosphate synthase
VGERERAEVMQWLSLPRTGKRQDEAEWVLSLMHREGSIDYGTRVAMDYAAEATELFEERLSFLPESEPKAVLRQVANYVNTREL